MKLEFQCAVAEDVQAIYGLCKALIDTYEDISSIDYPKVLRWVEQKISFNIANYRVITVSGKKAGYYALERQEDCWELDDFYILPEFRGKGIGSAVLESICGSTDGRIILYVFTKNTGAIKLYERFGFQTAKRISSTRQIMERPG